MGKRRDSREQEAAFVMEGDDRFHKILASDGVRFESSPGWEAVVTFFVIRRASGTFSIVNVTKTFKGDTCVSRKVRTRDNVTADAIDRETARLTGAFTEAIEAELGKRLVWHTLELSTVTDVHEQTRRIAEWGRVGVRAEMPPGPGKPSVN